MPWQNSAYLANFGYEKIRPKLQRTYSSACLRLRLQRRVFSYPTFLWNTNCRKSWVKKKTNQKTERILTSRHCLILLVVNIGFKLIASQMCHRIGRAPPARLAVPLNLKGHRGPNSNDMHDCDATEGISFTWSDTKAPEKMIHLNQCTSNWTKHNNLWGIEQSYSYGAAAR